VQIERLPEWDMTPEIEAEIADLVATCFTTDFGNRSYYQQRHHVRFTAREDGRLLGHMALGYRDIRVGGALTPVWGLAEVATHPSARGKGIATALLHAAIAFTRTTPAAFFVLFGNRPMYAGNGFVRQSNTLTYFSLIGAKTGEKKDSADGGLMVLPLTDQPWDEIAHVDLLGHKF